MITPYAGTPQSVT